VSVCTDAYTISEPNLQEFEFCWYQAVLADSHHSISAYSFKVVQHQYTSAQKKHHPITRYSFTMVL